MIADKMRLDKRQRVGYTQADTDEMVLSFILTFMETVRFLLKDSAKTLSPNMYVSGHST